MSESSHQDKQAEEKYKEEVVDKKFKKKKEIFGLFDRYDYMLTNLQSFKQQLAQKLNRRHNEYTLNIYNNKIGCYQKYGSDAISYFECFDKVEEMINKNFTKLQGHCEGLNFMLDKCLEKCSKTSSTNEQFENCAKGPTGCFEDYKNKTRALYKKMYKVVLQKKIQ